MLLRKQQQLYTCCLGNVLQLYSFDVIQQPVWDLVMVISLKSRRMQIWKLFCCCCLQHVTTHRLIITELNMAQRLALTTITATILLCTRYDFRSGKLYFPEPTVFSHIHQRSHIQYFLLSHLVLLIFPTLAWHPFCHHSLKHPENIFNVKSVK